MVSYIIFESYNRPHFHNFGRLAVAGRYKGFLNIKITALLCTFAFALVIACFLSYFIKVSLLLKF